MADLWLRAWDFMLEHSWPQFSELLLAGSVVSGCAEVGLLLVPGPPVAQALPPRAPALPPLRPE